MASLDREDAENDEDNFKSWGVEKLISYLLEREVPVGNTNKQGLIILAVFARKLGLKVVKSVRESQREVESERLSKSRGRIVLSATLSYHRSTRKNIGMKVS